MKDGLTPLLTDVNFCVEHAFIPAKRSMHSPHYHNYYEVYYFLGDYMTYFIENKSFHVRKFDMVFINKFTYHKTLYGSREPGERYLVKFSDDALKVIYNQKVINKILRLFQMKKLSFPDRFNQTALQVFSEKIHPAFIHGNPDTGNIRSLFAFLDLLLSITEMVDEGLIEEDSSPINSKEQRVSEIVKYINRHYAGNLNLDALSKHFFINKYYMCHIFKEVTGVSILSFIHNKRLVEAEKLLRYTKHSVTKISQEVGFNNVNHFITLFKGKYKCTPGVFRNQVSG